MVAILVLVLLLDVAVFRWANRVSASLNENRMLVTEKVFGPSLSPPSRCSLSSTALPWSGFSHLSATERHAIRRDRAMAGADPASRGTHEPAEATGSP